MELIHGNLVITKHSREAAFASTGEIYFTNVTFSGLKFRLYKEEFRVRYNGIIVYI